MAQYKEKLVETLKLTEIEALEFYRSTRTCVRTLNDPYQVEAVVTVWRALKEQFKAQVIPEKWDQFFDWQKRNGIEPDNRPY